MMVTPSAYKNFNAMSAKFYAMSAKIFSFDAGVFATKWPDTSGLISRVYKIFISNPGYLIK
jgi:hypothetical protein